MSASPRVDGKIPFHRPFIAPNTPQALARALASGALVGGGPFTAACHELLTRETPGGTPFLTTSCTDALEMAALLLRLEPGDEVVMPAWTFPSTANAVALRGAIPVFVDVDPGTLNLDPGQAAAAIGPRTRAVFCVHYAGVGCDMDALAALCAWANLTLVEDAAQGYGARWRDRALGGIGDIGTYSFHGTKNVGCGEGGALIVNRPELVALAEMIWEKGTDRLRNRRGETPHYEWCELGSSFVPSELTAAMLAEQLAAEKIVTRARRVAWDRYHALLTTASADGLLRLPEVPEAAYHNGHIFAVRLRDAQRRTGILAHLAEQGIEARTHYRALHRSPAGRACGLTRGPLPVTEAAEAELIRLPLDGEITALEQERVVQVLLDGLR